jgi:hypothetical protein
VAIALVLTMFGVLVTTALDLVQRVRLPFAKTSVALLVLLLCSLPLRNVDDVVRRPPAAMREARLLYDHYLTGSFTLFPIILATRTEDELRLRAMQAAGTLRVDAHVVTTTRPDARTAQRESAREPALITIFRDVVISGSPEALSLSELARERGVYLLDPHVGKSGARHVVPAGLGFEFFPEPRGRADRARGLATLGRERARFASLRFAPGVSGDFARRLRTRILAMGNADDVDMVSVSLEDLRSLKNDDPWLLELPRRIVTGRGRMDTQGLDPR